MLMIPNSGYLMETSVAAYRMSNYSLPGNLNWLFTVIINEISPRIGLPCIVDRGSYFKS